MNSEAFNAVLAYLRDTKLSKMLSHAAILGLLCVILSFCYTIAFHFTSLLTIYTEAHDIRNFGNNLNGNMKAESQLEDILKKALTESHANRSYVYRYHNGLAAISSVPFYFQSMMFEVISPGIPRIIAYEQRLPAGMTPIVNAAFVQNKCFVSTALDKTDHALNFMFQTHGARAVVRCPIYMKNGDLFGFVGVEYHDAQAEINTATRQTLEFTAREIAAVYANLKH
jgi:hypothetical protein